jgi:ABC-type glycerol-3-phosphate transport system permease component
VFANSASAQELSFFLILATLMIPFQCYIIPLYLMSVAGESSIPTRASFSNHHLQLRHLLRQAEHADNPDSLIEAAKIDGASICGPSSHHPAALHVLGRGLAIFSS